MHYIDSKQMFYHSHTSQKLKRCTNTHAAAELNDGQIITIFIYIHEQYKHKMFRIGRDGSRHDNIIYIQYVMPLLLLLYYIYQ